MVSSKPHISVYTMYIVHKLECIFNTKRNVLNERLYRGWPFHKIYRQQSCCCFVSNPDCARQVFCWKLVAQFFKQKWSRTKGSILCWENHFHTCYLHILQSYRAEHSVRVHTKMNVCLNFDCRSDGKRWQIPNHQSSLNKMEKFWYSSKFCRLARCANQMSVKDLFSVKIFL